MYEMRDFCNYPYYFKYYILLLGFQVAVNSNIDSYQSEI